MATTYIPPEHSLLRHVSWTRLERDEDSNPIGVLPQAFALREGEQYLSATWLEYHQGHTRDDKIAQAVTSIRSSINVKPRCGFAIGRVQEIDAIGEKHRRNLRFIHAPGKVNKAHVAVRNWPQENADLFEQMAAEGWAELVLNENIP